LPLLPFSPSARQVPCRHSPRAPRPRARITGQRGAAAGSRHCIDRILNIATRKRISIIDDFHNAIRQLHHQQRFDFGMYTIKTTIRLDTGQVSSFKMGFSD
jgi:hypothetical protein